MKANDKFNLKFYNKIKNMINLPMKLIFNTKVIGTENLPKKPYILIGNHKSIWDVPLLVSNINDDIHFMAKKELFDITILKNIIEKMGAFPINRDVADIKALRKTLCLLKEGSTIGMFPEGTRNKTSNILLPFKCGAIKIAKKTNSLIVPFGISGKYKFRSKLVLNIGKPIDISFIKEYDENKYIEDRVKELILK